MSLPSHCGTAENRKIVNISSGKKAFWRLTTKGGVYVGFGEFGLETGVQVIFPAFTVALEVFLLVGTYHLVS